MLESVYRADSNSAVRKGMWVRLPPAAPEIDAVPTVECVADPPDVTACFDRRQIDGVYAYLLGMYLKRRNAQCRAEKCLAPADYARCPLSRNSRTLFVGDGSGWRPNHRPRREGRMRGAV